MSAIELFEFQEHPVRVVLIENDPWWVAVDVCRALTLTNPRKAVDRLDQEDVNTVTLSDGIRGNPNVNVINESGLYSLILRSDKPEAKAFKRWVTKEVLPAIRKTGGYGSRVASLESALAVVIEAAHRLHGRPLRMALANIAAGVSAGLDVRNDWQTRTSPRWLQAEASEVTALFAALGPGDHYPAAVWDAIKSRGLFQRVISPKDSIPSLRSRIGKLLARYDGRALGGFHFETCGIGRKRQFILTSASHPKLHQKGA